MGKKWWCGKREENRKNTARAAPQTVTHLLGARGKDHFTWRAVVLDTSSRD
ncbi:hypothetical protein WN55_03506 [Dufourea novaeangliae]|uniref:Uncharacterized protein n=1 Tax=Dufourea novaeangliae TaxID=178035 RepID=A0A154PJE3_DUFNO|nr:hypothetical protein WN55_03506 [Dufourea novaeangliae]